MTHQWLDVANKMIDNGKEFLEKNEDGSPKYDYKTGATFGRDQAFDCSSFTQYLYSTVGVDIPRVSREQAQAGTEIEWEDVREGDLLAFTNESRKDRKGIDSVGHVGIYIGDGKMFHTAKVGIGPVIKNVVPYWKSMLITVRRFIKDDGTPISIVKRANTPDQFVISIKNSETHGYLFNGIPYVPVREIAKLIDAPIALNGKQVTIGGKNIINSKLYSGVTFTSFEEFNELTGESAVWDQQSNTLTF